jgi:hypothetical protein
VEDNRERFEEERLAAYRRPQGQVAEGVKL